MKFPFTYHSKKDHRLVCIHFNEQYHIINIEVWDELHQHWITVSGASPAYDAYLSDFREEVTHSHHLR